MLPGPELRPYYLAVNARAFIQPILRNCRDLINLYLISPEEFVC